MKAINTAGADAKNNKANKIDLGDDIASKVKKKVSLDYVEGLPQAGRSSEEVDGLIDRSTKAPYGRKGMGWVENTGKLGDLDPQETDQPNWVGTWSILQEGPNGAGPTRDENYPVQRPRTKTRQFERFEQCNPEFQDVADHGDWTSYEWTNNV